jgi:dTDP-4-dehydrorhamnose reductase
MLGSMVAHHLGGDESLDVTATFRPTTTRLDWPARVPSVSWREFSGPEDLHVVAGHDWVVNCVGVIKPLIAEDDPVRVEDAVRTNSLLPYQLAATCAESGASLIQIATDCVYSGSEGRYGEGALHDAIDVYGKTKSLGEVPAAHVHHIRASIVGPETARARSLLEWFLGHPRGAVVSGYLNHRWNGVTTLHFSKVARGIISGVDAPRRHHLVPAGEISKHDLLRCFAEAYDRGDLTIEGVNASTVIDRTLVTEQQAANLALWNAAGYQAPPSVGEMVTELAGYPYLPAAMAAAA